MRYEGFLRPLCLGSFSEALGTHPIARAVGHTPPAVLTLALKTLAFVDRGRFSVTLETLNQLKRLDQLSPYSRLAAKIYYSSLKSLPAKEAAVVAEVVATFREFGPAHSPNSAATYLC